MPIRELIAIGALTLALGCAGALMALWAADRISIITGVL